MSPASTDFSNVEIVVLAVYLLGGTDGPVDTEDVAVLANKLAPGRFTWRRHKSQISLEHIRVYLSDAKKQKNGKLLSGDGTRGWQLTSAGLKQAMAIRAGVGGASLGRVRSNPVEDHRRKAEKARLSLLPAWGKFHSSVMVGLREAEAVFRLTDYVSDRRREFLIDRVRLLFVHNPEFEPFVEAMAAIVSARTPSESDDNNKRS